MNLDELLPFLDCVKPARAGAHPSNESFKACCPAHNDKNPSLSIAIGQRTRDGRRRILMRCWSGCLPSEIVGALGLRQSDLVIDEEAPRARPADPTVRELSRLLGCEVSARDALRAYVERRGRLSHRQRLHACELIAKILAPAPLWSARASLPALDRAAQAVRLMNEHPDAEADRRVMALAGIPLAPDAGDLKSLRETLAIVRGSRN